MTDRFELLAQALINKSFSDCTAEELLQLNERYPYLAPAHFLHLKKMDPAATNYHQAYQQAVLYYSNPAGFQHFIQNPQNDWETELGLEEITTYSVDQDNGVEDQIPASIEEHDIDVTVAPTMVTTNSTDKEVESAKTSSDGTQDSVSPTQKQEIAFEPFHTVDYFASMGIKLSQDDASKDKLGKQLKSFTDWLKVMKKLPAQEKSSLGGKDERQVESMAAYSVKSSDVITESMAEVWLRQGNKARAIDVYRKLSLLNPGKSAYFAAKIDHLNDSN